MRIRRPVPLTSRPRVSVVIPCYNYGHYLTDAVASALDQRDVDVEVIVVDDCSTDDSADVADALAARHPQVTVIRNPVNLRHIATYGVGLSRANGEYVALLSADDRLAPGSLDRAAALFRAHPEVGLVYGQILTFDEGTLPPPTTARSWTVWKGSEWLARACRSTDNFITSPEAVVRRDVLARTGGYDARFPHAADMLFWLQAAALGDVGRINGTQAYYRLHGSNMHDSADLLTDIRERVGVLEHFLDPESGYVSPPQAARWSEQARRTFAREALRYASADLGSTDESTTALMDFARDQWPGVATTRLWTEVERSRRAELPAWRAELSRISFRLRWALRWQRRHRWGV